MSTSTTHDADHLAAAELARVAGEALLAVRSENTELMSSDPRALKDLGDHASHDLMVAWLGERFPHDAVLSEEGADDPARLGADRVWIVDPLDGTREFGESGRDDWAVHVALWVRGELTAGAVGRPAKGKTYATGDVSPLPARADGPVRLAVSRSRPPAFVTALGERLRAETVAMGSAGVKAMSVVDGEADAYVHAGGQYEWDSAAPVAVAAAHGLYTSRIDGSPLLYNQPNPYLPDLVICRPGIADDVLTAISALST